VKRAYTRYIGVPIGDRMVRLIQFQMIEIILAEHFNHSRVPNQVALHDRCGRKPLKEIRPKSTVQIIAIAEAFHKIAFLSSTERSRSAISSRLSYVVPHDFSARQPTSVFRCEALALKNV